MLVILSQKIDTESAYSDDIFRVYHYPGKYKNQLHVGDTFIYYQGDRSVREYRYYFGMGVIGSITNTDDDNYYAELINCSKFKHTIPIYLPDGGYIEQLGYEKTRKRPPWQSSIRPISQQAFDYILSVATVEQIDNSDLSVDELNELLKTHIRRYYLEKDFAEMKIIRDIAEKLCKKLNI